MVRHEENVKKTKFTRYGTSKLSIDPAAIVSTKRGKQSSPIFKSGMIVYLKISKAGKFNIIIQPD
jgi:hypothetical protein